MHTTSPTHTDLNSTWGAFNRRLAAIYLASPKLLTAGLWGTSGDTLRAQNVTSIWAGISLKAQATMRSTDSS